MMKRFLVLFLLLSLPLAAFSQQPEGYAAYLGAAGMDMPLFRARVADSYDFPYNGTYLIDTRGFGMGSVVYAGKVYSGLMFNLDAALHHVLVRMAGSPVTLDLGDDLVESFTRGETVYENLRLKGIKVPAGFYELLAKGPGGSVYCRTEKLARHLSDLNYDARNYIGYEDPDYKRGVADYFEQKQSWYLVRPDGSVRRLRTQGQVRNAIQSVYETH